MSQVGFGPLYNPTERFELRVPSMGVEGETPRAIYTERGFCTRDIPPPVGDHRQSALDLRMLQVGFAPLHPPT